MSAEPAPSTPSSLPPPPAAPSSANDHAPASAAGNPAPPAASEPPKPGSSAALAPQAGSPAPASEPPKPDAAATAKPPEGVWSENWREAYAGDDTAKLNVLKRYADPKTALDALFNLQEKVRSGDIKKPLAKDATPEQVAAWRKDNGVPDAPEAYLKSLPEGIVFGGQDKAAVDSFLKEMHDSNASPEIVAKALASYHKAQIAVKEQFQMRDRSKAEAAEDTLRKEWGPDFKPNITVMKAFLENNFPSDVHAALLDSRLGDDEGTPLLAHPGVIRAFTQLGRALNPTGTITSGAGMDSLDTINEQIKGYEKRMASKEWFKDEKSQAHYRDLVTARERLKPSGR